MLIRRVEAFLTVTDSNDGMTVTTHSLQWPSAREEITLIIIAAID